jgi:hypothetical protein
MNCREETDCPETVQPDRHAFRMAVPISGEVSAMETHLKLATAGGKVISERRGGVRRRVLKGAVMIFNRGYSTFECVVRNESDGGAKLSLAETFALPKTFTLTVMAEEQGRVVDIVWRSASEIGVRYRDTAGGPLQAA